MELFYRDESGLGLTAEQQQAAVAASLSGLRPRRTLLIPPDYTRFWSGAGYLTCQYYALLCGGGRVDVLPALGTHAPMTAAQIASMYPGIPADRFLVHDWRRDVLRLGEVPGDYLASVSEGLWTEPIAVEVNRLVAEGDYDLIVSIGQVVPHEVAGMANHAKNLFVGVGGSDMINKTHMLGAVYGLERMMGRDRTPVRAVFDYALTHFLADRPITFALTTATAPTGEPRIHGLFLGDTRRVFEEAVASARQHNMTWLPEPVQTCVAYLDPAEFTSTWLGNKAVYRTRMAIADGGRLLILAPGVRRFGEDPACDALIRKYGYRGRDTILRAWRENRDLRENMSAAAHLIHGSADGRFTITYGVEAMPTAEMAGVGYQAADYASLAARYDPARLVSGYNTLPDGEQVYFVPNPALGLWGVSK